MDKIAKGQKILASLLGAKACENIVKTLDEEKPGYSDYMFYSYGEFYSDDAIDIKVKELLVVAALVTQKGTLAQLKGHLNACKDAGLTKNEVCAAISHLTIYIGFPAVMNALMVVNGVYDDN